MRNSEDSQERNRRVFRCEHPVAFVTGSFAQRVGRFIADQFSDQGFRVVLHSHREAPADMLAAEQAAGRHTLIGPVQDEAGVQAWRKQVVRWHGRVDVVVNSAAVWDPIELNQTTASAYRRVFDINALGTALVSQEFGNVMASQESGGAIVNISDWALRRPYVDFAAYFASKGAVESLSKALAVELASRNPNVRVNCVQPGPVLLDARVSAEREKQIIADSLLRRAGTPQDLAEAVWFLATHPFLTGVGLPVDGGRSIYAGASPDRIAHPDAR